MEDIKSLDGQLYKQILTYGALNLKKNIKIVNDLNVFPVPDGDTGDNMCMTIENGLASIEALDDTNIGEISKKLSKGMLMGARGNSGVILSQIFRGMSNYLADINVANTKDLSNAFISGVKQAYSAVRNPVEGTILTVARVASEEAAKSVHPDTTIQDFLWVYLNIAKDTLDKTPEMLDVLKKANVIDSGGAGYVCIIEGMLKCLNGEHIDATLEVTKKPQTNAKAFGPDSELDFGYCTEFILQLQTKKVDIATFNVETITSFLETIGDSIVALKDEDVIKVHVHTKDPGKVLTFGRQYGEYVTIKIENMALQHNEIVMEKKDHKKYGVVSVATGIGLSNTFKEYGTDVVVTGGQTMNPSTEDFITAFNQLDCDNILVFPNNSNIIMTANQAKEIYDKANIIVIPTKTLGEGLSALSMLNFDDDSFIDEINETIKNVITGEITYSIRDTNFDGIELRKNEYMGIIKKTLCAADDDKFETLKKLVDYVMDNEEKEVITIIFGKDVEESELEDSINYIQNKYKYVDVTTIDGGQDVYSFIVTFE